MVHDKTHFATNMKVSPPDWLNTSLIQEALRRGGEENYNVKQLTLKPAIAPGDNYGSVIYRATVKLQDGDERSVLVKVLPPGEFGKLAQSSGIFRRESNMFANVVPKMEAVLNAAAPGRYPPLTARGLHQGTDPSEFIVLEDLRPQGFKMADRHKGLGLRHSLLALRALARFHAASAAVLDQNPSLWDSMKQFGTDNESFSQFLLSAMDSSADAFRTWPGFEDCADSLEAFKPQALSKVAEISLSKPGQFTVISHGDFWTNNMMFRYEGGVPQDIRLVDLQMGYITSPALDLLYFFGTSPSEDVSIHHQDLLLREYHKALSEAMELLERKAPSLEELLEDFDARGSCAIIGTLYALPFIKATQEVDVDAVVVGDNSRTDSLYQQPVVKRWLQRLIPLYKRRGWLP